MTENSNQGGGGGGGISACHIGTFSSRTGNPVVQYFHGYVVKQMKLSLLQTKMMQRAGDIITVWFTEFVIILSRG